MSDQLDIEAIEARENAATAPPWTVRGCKEHPDGSVRACRAIRGPDGIRITDWQKNEQFICHARDDVPALRLEVLRLRKQVEELQRMQVVTKSPAVTVVELGGGR